MRKIKLNVSKVTFQKYFKDMGIELRLINYELLLRQIVKNMQSDGLEIGEKPHITSEYLNYLILMGELSGSIQLIYPIIPDKSIQELSLFMSYTGDDFEDLKYKFMPKITEYDIRIAKRIQGIVSKGVFSKKESKVIFEKCRSLFRESLASFELTSLTWLKIGFKNFGKKVGFIETFMLYADKLWGIDLNQKELW